VETSTPVAEASAPDQSRIKQLEEEVAALKKNAQQLTDDLSLEKDVVAELTQTKTDLQNSLREAQALTNGESSEFERRLRESASNCARLTTELEQERAERRRADQRASTLAPQLKALHEQLIQHLGTQSMSKERIDALEKQIREGNESLNKLTSDLDKERSERKLAEEQLSTSGELVAQLRNCLSAFDEAKKGYKRTNDELQARLVSNQNATKELEAKLQKQAGEHQRLEEVLSAAQRQLQEQAEQNTYEISRLKSALESKEAEHKRLEVESIQLRYASLDSARSGLANANKFRRQIQEPVDQLIQNMRRLLEVPLEEEPKQLVQSMLENAIFLQGNVQEIGKTYTKSATPEQQPAPEKLAA
jgi:chromosome segregation ATPase